MKTLSKLMLYFLACAFIAACSEDDQPESQESYLKGIYSNYTNDEQPNLDATYNSNTVKDKEVSINTIDNVTFDITLKNILETPNVLFSDVILQKSDDNYTCKMDSTINNKKIHLDIKISPKFNQNNSDKANANMILNVTESNAE